MQCKQKSGSVRLRGDTRFAYTVGAPMFAYLLIVLIIPVCWGLYISFTDKMIGSQGHFVGLKNYINLLKNGSFRKVLSVFYMNGRLTNFFDGILDISAIVYYVSVIVFFLFLTVQTIAKRRWN